MSSPAQTLQDLIDKAMIKHQVRSAAALARVGKAAGYRVSHTTISDMRSGKYPWVPSEATLEMLADLAGVSLEEAYAAADMGDPGEPYTPPKAAKHLNPKQRELVDMIIRALVESQEQNERSDTNRPNFRTDRVTGPQASVAYITEADLEPLIELNHSDESGSQLRNG